MMVRNLKHIAFGFLLVAATFDAIVIPGIRLSVADCAMLSSLAAFGFTRETIRRCIYFAIWVFPIVLMLNAVVFLFFEAGNVTKNVDFSSLLSGFVRPAFFILLSICFYGQMEKYRFSRSDIYSVIIWAGLSLSFIVFLQYIGVFPSMYHNNPSFGEAGRYTVFAEGWRPTGLTNEASFVGIFLFLLFVASSQTQVKNLARAIVVREWAPIMIFCGCFFTTSRLAVLLAVVFALLQKPSLKKGVLLVLGGLAVIPLLDISRFGNVFAFDGDASTIERYGSLFAYWEALGDPATLFGTGYLNSSSVVLPHIDPIVLQVLGERQLPAFSLPLQLLVELGPILCGFIIILCLLKWRASFNDRRLYAVIVVSFLTGIQNFLFIYVFVALVFYDRHSCSTQAGWRCGTHSETS